MSRLHPYECRTSQARALSLSGSRLAAFALTLGLVGCAHEAAPQPSTAMTRQVTSTTTVTQAIVQKPEGDSVVIAPEIRKACDLPSDPGSAPKFDFNSATLKTDEASVLDSLARCLKDGGLGDQKLVMIGFTDPRGSDEYNLRLGQERADATKQYLIDQGVPDDQLSTDSRGKSEAHGTDETTWALDRRVEVRLANPMLDLDRR